MHIQSSTQYRAEGYSRNLLAKTQSLEVLHLNWRPGQHTPVHGHGNTEGMLYVLEGEMTVLTYYPEGHVQRQTFGPGELYFSPHGIIHQVINEGPGDLRTLHFYAPPLAMGEGREPSTHYHNWGDIVPYLNTRGEMNFIHDLLALEMAPVESPADRGRLAPFIDEATHTAFLAQREFAYQI